MMCIHNIMRVSTLYTLDAYITLHSDILIYMYTEAYETIRIEISIEVYICVRVGVYDV